jgi:ABC-type sugar transport system ATPase subunit
MKVSANHSANPLLEMRRIDKSFAGVHALRDVSLQLNRGEVLALVGENGAGKSTLIKVLGGAHLPDRGEMRIDGRPASFETPADANRAGIAIIYQEFNLIPDLSVCENIFLGREATRFGFVRKSDERAAASKLFATIVCRFDHDTRCLSLSVF